MKKHDEPNEYGFAGGATAPEPPPPGHRDTVDAAEAIAVPGTDLTTELSEALGDASRRRPEEEAPESGSR